MESSVICEFKGFIIQIAEWLKIDFVQTLLSVRTCKRRNGRPLMLTSQVPVGTASRRILSGRLLQRAFHESTVVRRAVDLNNQRYRALS